jgi:hypothetical protein
MFAYLCNISTSATCIQRKVKCKDYLGRVVPAFMTLIEQATDSALSVGNVIPLVANAIGQLRQYGS